MSIGSCLCHPGPTLTLKTRDDAAFRAKWLGFLGVVKVEKLGQCNVKVSGSLCTMDGLSS